MSGFTLKGNKEGKFSYKVETNIISLNLSKIEGRSEGHTIRY